MCQRWSGGGCGVVQPATSLMVKVYELVMSGTNLLTATKRHDSLMSRTKRNGASKKEFVMSTSSSPAQSIISLSLVLVLIIENEL